MGSGSDGSERRTKRRFMNVLKENMRMVGVEEDNNIIITNVVIIIRLRLMLIIHCGNLRREQSKDKQQYCKLNWWSSSIQAKCKGLIIPNTAWATVGNNFTLV